MDNKGVYISISDIANCVTGGLIYPRNKLKYMREKGWEVRMLPTNTGKVYINGLKEYAGLCYPFIYKSPTSYTWFERRKLLNKLCESLPKTNGPIVIETGTDYSAYWGELLAKKLRAKHIIVFLDEHNDKINKKVAPFFEFKYARRELACINKQAMHVIFGNYFDIPEDKAYGVNCFCSNSVEDYDSPVTGQIIKGDYTIGTIGRLDKPCVPVFVEGIKRFAALNPGKTISAVFFGGATQEIIDNIKRDIGDIENVVSYFTDYIFPLPVEALRKCDMFVSMSGSALASACVGIPTVDIDLYTFKPMGIILNDMDKKLLKLDSDSLLDYFDYILIKKQNISIVSSGYEKQWEIARERYADHLRFLEESERSLYYAPLKSIGWSFKSEISAHVRFFIGKNNLDKMRTWIFSNILHRN